jgi:hypothetical protein
MKSNSVKESAQKDFVWSEFHNAPKGYSYEVEQFKHNFLAIWIYNHGEFSYTNKTPKSIWGFYNTRTKCYHAPINASKQGDKVRIEDTSPYSAMQLKLTPLEQCMYPK